MNTEVSKRKPIKNVTLSPEVVEYAEGTRAMPEQPIKSFSKRIDELATLGMRYEIKRAEREAKQEQE